MIFDMKKVVIVLSALVLMVFGGCKKDKPVEQVCPEGAVDLGIVMTRKDGTTYKLFWAKTNLSESGLCANETDYGDYYAWGETKPYYSDGHSQDNPCSSWRTRMGQPISGYDWESYIFRTSGDSYDNVIFSKYSTLESYGNVDNITELQRGEKEGETVDDAARAILHGKWRMPTEKEWAALIALKWEWTSRDGINGRLVTGENGNSIFLPTSGGRAGTMLSSAGTFAYYWSSSLNFSSPYSAYYVRFDGENIFSGSDSRSHGFAIRPVSE